MTTRSAKPPTTCANCVANNSWSNRPEPTATRSPLLRLAQSRHYSHCVIRSSRQSSPAWVDLAQGDRPRPAPASTATTRTSATTCAPCSTTWPSTPPHRQQIVDPYSQAPIRKRLGAEHSLENLLG